MFKDKCPSVSSLGSDGNTSFLRAARAGHLEKVLEYLQSNIDINTSNANGLNALHLASKDGHIEVVTELLKRGAVVDSATKKGNTALHIASLAGQEEVVRLLVQHGASVNVQSQNGFTPLYMAAQENHDSVVKYLLASGANQSLATEDGFTPLAVAMQQGHDKVVAVLLENDTRGKVRLPALHIAAKKDDVKAAKLLLENEHNPDVTSKSGFTPLHIASHYGNESIANLLIQKGADVNYAAKHNITPLHVAAKWGKSNMVALLLERGAHIEAKTRDGLTPLHCAARSGHEQVVDMLLERGAPISSKTKNGLAPLHMAAQGDHVDAARILLYHRAPVDEVTVDYLTALHVAAHCGHARVAKLLLDRQADANARALNGFTPLHIACKKNRIKVVELLLKHGASIGATTESGLTPLHVASFMGCMNIVIYLLQHEANPDVPTVRGETPLHLAARANQTDIIRILLRNGAQVDARAREQQTPLHIASRLGNVDIVMLLLQHGAQVDTTTKDMYTALHIAAKEGQDEVAAVLLEHGASLSATTKKGFTPLHLAAKYGNMKVAKLLLQREAPVDAQGKNGVTPLHVASHYDHQNVALLLLDKGASPHATAKNGHTPLHISAKKNQMDIATTLLEYGAQANAESKAGFTPLHLSSQEGHTDMSSLLIEHKADCNHHAKNGLAPIHLCAQEDRTDVAKILVKSGAEVDSVTKAGYTPLHVASHFGQVNMVKFLLQNGADVKATTGIGYTPLHQASQQGHANVVALLLENSAQANATTNSGQTPLQIAQKVGYISVIDMLKAVTTPTISPPGTEEKYRVVAPEAMHETFMSDSEEEGGEDTMLADQPYRYLTVDEMKSLGDDSLPIDVTRDERIDSNRMVTSGDGSIMPPQAMEDSISPQHISNNYSEFNSNKYAADNVDIGKHPVHFGFLVSFLVDARGGAMRGCRHSGVRVIVPPRCAASPTRITCRYVKPQRTPHPPPLMEGEALASRVLELGPVGAKFLGPVILEVPHFAALRGKEREIVILRSDNGETWREHTVEASEDIVHDVLNDSFEAEDLSQLEDVSSGRITRILTHDFPQYFAVVSRIRQEVHAIGPEGGMVSSTVVPQVQAVFPQGALTKKIKVGLQAQPIDPELAAKLLGHGVAVSPVVTVEPRRRKFHKAITLSMPAPRAHSQGMINQYSGSAPTLRLLCSITGGTTRAQWEDVTGSTPLTFVNDCVSFTTTVSARFWLMDCRNIGDATKMATELYREAIHVPFMAKFVVFAKRVDPLEARLRVFCMTDDKEDKTLEHQEHFTEVAKSRDVEVLEGKPQYVEFAGNLVPITKSGEQLQFAFRAFRENRLPFSVRVKDQHADTVGRCLFMKEPKVVKGDPPQQPICILNIVLPDDIVTETISLVEPETLRKRGFLRDDFYQKTRITDISNLLGEDWVPLASELGLSTSEINVIKSEYPDSVAKQAQSMLRMWKAETGNKATRENIESALRRIGREDIIPQCFSVDALDHAIAKVTRDQGGFDTLKEELGPSRAASLRREISLDTAVYERDIMKDSESVESLVQAERKGPFEESIQNLASREESKYSAEEKVLTDQEREEEFKKSVREHKKEIEKRLSEERRIPASAQRVEIVQEITTIKRQSLVEEKIKDGEFDGKPVENKYETEPEQITTTVTKTQIISNKDKPEIVKKEETIEIKKVSTEKVTTDSKELEKKLETQKKKIEEYERTSEQIPQIITETRTTEITHRMEPTASERRSSDSLMEGVSQQLEKLETGKKSVPMPRATEDLKSPKQSKTPPPSPADFNQREKTAAIQEWSKPEDGNIIGDKPSKGIASQVASTEETCSRKQAILTDEAFMTNIDEAFDLTSFPKPKPRAKTPDTKTIISVTDDNLKTDEDDTTESYTDKKKFWESVSTQQVPTEIVPMKKRMSLHDGQVIKEKEILVKKRTSIHDVSITPPVPKPRSTVVLTEQPEDTKSKVESLDTLQSEYKSSFKDPSTVLTKTEQELKSESKSLKSESLDSEKEYIAKYGDLQSYENTAYESDAQDDVYDVDAELPEHVIQVKRRQMSVSQPPVAAARKTIFERSVSLPTEDILDITAQGVKAKKRFFEQQIKTEMVIDQLMTAEEEQVPEVKTLSFEIKPSVLKITEEPRTSTTVTEIKSVGQSIEIVTTTKDEDKKLSPMSSSSSQDTKTEDDITQDTPTSVKDLVKTFQIIQEGILIPDEIDMDITPEMEFIQQEVKRLDDVVEDVQTSTQITRTEHEKKDIYEHHITTHEKRSSTASEHSISSERSVELGSIDDLPFHIPEHMHYKSDSISKPSDSMEVHVDKSEIEDSEKLADMEQDGTDIEQKSFDSDGKIGESEYYLDEKEDFLRKEERILSSINQPLEQIPDTVWEVVQSQPVSILEEQVQEIHIEKQTIIEHDDDFSGSAREESELGSEIHLDHSESIESEKIKSESQIEVEKIILESLYQQKIEPDEAKKIAAELVDGIEAEIERRNLAGPSASDDVELPTADTAQNQISEYIRKLAEYKGLDAKEMQLVESVLARKQREISRLGRRDTQTSSMEITDEDLRYSGAEYDISPSDSQENILEEQIEHLETEKCFIDQTKLHGIPSIVEERYVERKKESSVKELRHSKAHTPDDADKIKSEISGKIETQQAEEKIKTTKSQRRSTDEGSVLEKIDEIVQKTTSSEKISAGVEDITQISDDTISILKASATTVQDESGEIIQKTTATTIETDTSKKEQVKTAETDISKFTASGGVQSEEHKIEAFDDSIKSSSKFDETKISDDTEQKIEKLIESTEEVTVSDDGTETKTSEFTEKIETKTTTTSQITSHKREECVTSTIFEKTFTVGKDTPLSIEEVIEEHNQEQKHTSSEDSKSSQDEYKSPDSTSAPKDDSELSRFFEKGVVLRKHIRRDLDTSSSSGNLRGDRKSGADFENYSSSGESHYHSFELDSGKSRPCSSDVEGLVVGSSEYESALTSQDMSSRSHVTSAEYHTAVSSLSSRGSMKSLDSESSGNMASIEVSEASETLVPSTSELEGDILDESVNQLLEDDFTGHKDQFERMSRPFEHGKDALPDLEPRSESMDISEEDSPPDKQLEEVSGKMKRSQEMTFQPEPKVVIPDSPQSEHTLEMDERFGTSLEDGSVLSISLSSTSDAAQIRTVIESSRRDSYLADSLGASGVSLDDLDTLSRSYDDHHSSSLPSGIMMDNSTSTPTGQDGTMSSVMLTTSVVQENGTQSVSTQIVSHTQTTEKNSLNGPTQVEYIPEYDDIVEPKKVRGHRRNESTSSFVPPKIAFVPTADSDKFPIMTLKEEYSDELKDVDEVEKKPEPRMSIGAESDIEGKSDIDADEKPDPELTKLMSDDSSDIGEPIDRPITPEPREEYEIKLDGGSPKLDKYERKQSSSERSSFEEAEADPVFSMVAHVSPAHKAKGLICPIPEDEDAEKHELEARELAQKEMERRRQQIIQDHSPGTIPDITVTQHMTPLQDSGFHYPDLELEEREHEVQMSPQTPASSSSKSSVETDQGREYVLEDGEIIHEEPESGDERQITESKSDMSHTTVEDRTIFETESKEPPSATDSPNSDSFEMLEKPDIIDDFVVIEEVGKEAGEHDTEGIGLHIKHMKYVKKHDEEVEEYLVKSAPTPLTRMTDLKYYPDGQAPEDVGPFDFEDSPPTAAKKSAGTKTNEGENTDYAFEYDRDLEASKKWIEMQFQGEQVSTAPAGYGYEMDFERGPLEDIKEEEPADFDASSSRIGSLDSHKQSGGSLGSVKDSFSSTPEYDVLAGRKFFTRSGEHDDVSMSSLQEFEHLERVISLENRRHHQGSQDSSSNGSFSKRYHASKSGQGDDVSVSSLKEFEGLESACIEAHRIEIKAQEEEALLAQIEEGQENVTSESEISKDTSGSSDKDATHKSEEEDYEKRMFEIEEIIRQAQSNVEKFIDMKDLCEKTESMGRGDSLEEVAKVPDLELDCPIQRSAEPVKWEEDPMTTSVDSLDIKASRHSSADSLDMKTGTVDVMTASTDSIEFHGQFKSGGDNIMTDSIEIQDPDRSCMITSDSLELASVTHPNVVLSDSIDEDGSRIFPHDHSSSSGRVDEISSEREDLFEQQNIREQRREDYLLGSTDSLDPSSSTATHATYQYETDSVMSGSFTSGGSNTMVSSTDDPTFQQGHNVDISTAVRKVWFDDNTFSAGRPFASEILEDGSRPFVTEVIEPCEDDPEYSHTIHRRVELPPEIRKITFRGADAEEQLRKYIEEFGEGENVQESEEVDADGNVHVKRVVQKRFIVKSEGGDQMSSSEAHRDPRDLGLSRQTRTDADGTKIIYGHTTTFQGEESSLKELLSSIASDVAESSLQSEQTSTLTRHLDYQKEKDDSSTEKENKSASQSSSQQRDVVDQHQLSDEMKDLLAEMEKQAKH